MRWGDEWDWDECCEIYKKLIKSSKAKTTWTKNSVDHTQTKDMKTGGKGGLSREKRFGSSGMRERNGEKK